VAIEEKTMEEHAVRSPGTEDLKSLSREAMGIRAQLSSFNVTLQRAGISLPRGALEGLHQLGTRLIDLGDLLENIEEERHNLQALAEIGYMVNSSLELSTVLNEVMDTIIHLTGAERAFLMLSNSRNEMDIVIARNWEQEALKPGEHEISHTVINQVAESGEAVLTTNAQMDPRFDAMQSVVAYSLRSILCVPLKAKDNLIGVIYVDNKAREGIFNERHRALLSAFANQAGVAIENAQLFNNLSISYDQTLDALVAALDVRDHETEGHTRRVVLYSLSLAQKLGMPEEQQLDLRRGALMHDIGKLGIPDSVLLKKGALTEEEWEMMRRHPTLGVRMLEGIVFFKGAIEVIGSHHERYDGKGYPKGLKGEEIPLGARVFSVADALDAITSDRPYRKAQPFQVARDEITRGRGTQFDPWVVDAFLSVDQEEWLTLRAITMPKEKVRRSST
jgi:putative nucleotidyltransferase with HDIG domain